MSLTVSRSLKVLILGGLVSGERQEDTVRNRQTADTATNKMYCILDIFIAVFIDHCLYVTDKEEPLTGFGLS